MGTLEQKWGPNGDPKTEEGPHGDRVPQMGTHVGTVSVMERPDQEERVSPPWPLMGVPVTFLSGSKPENIGLET